MDYPRICPARWLTDPNFGMFMPPHDLIYPFYDAHSSYFRPWKCINRNISKEFSSTIENEKGNYKITLDVQHFRPNDISVKVTENEIIVEGKHEERPDTHGYISRQFKRRYALPSHCPAENVTSSMSSDGVLTIIAEKRTTNAMEKIVPIKMCGTIPRKTQIESKMTSEVAESSMREKESEVQTSDSKNYLKDEIKEEHSRLLKPELFKDTLTERFGETTAPKEINDITTAFEKKEGINIGATSTASKLEESLGKSNLGLSELSEQLCQRASTSETCGMKMRTEESSSSYESTSSLMTSTMKASGKIGEIMSDIISAELREAAENS